MVPLYCINLARRPDRWARMQAEAARFGATLIRVDAVDAQGPFDGEQNTPAPGPVLGAPINRGDLACSLSHRKTWEMIAEAGHDMAIVLEDDCVFAPGFGDVLGGDWVPDDAQVVKLETALRLTRLGPALKTPLPGRSLARLEKRHTGAAAALLTRDAIRLLLDRVPVFHDPVDQVLFNDRSAMFKILAPYQMTPAPVIQGTFVADAQTTDWAKSSIDGLRPEDAATQRAREAQRIHGSDEVRQTSTGKRLRHAVRGRLRSVLGTERVIVPFG